MNPIRASLLACAIAAFAGTASASSGSPMNFKPQVMPVVVQVDAMGKVTAILPSEHLRPKVRSLLVDQLDAWIAGPATMRGKAVASSFITEVAMHAAPRANGTYDVGFTYVNRVPMPFGGSVYWNKINGVGLALVSADPAGPARKWAVPPVPERVWTQVQHALPSTTVNDVRAASTRTAWTVQTTSGADSPMPPSAMTAMRAVARRAADAKAIGAARP